MKFLSWIIIFIYILCSGSIGIEARKDVKDILERKHFTLSTCAKACLEEKTLKCKYFKFIKTTGTCYLSSKDHPDFSSYASQVPKVANVKPQTTTAPKIDDGKIKNLLKNYKQAHDEEKKLKGVKNKLKQLKHAVKSKLTKKSKLDRKLSVKAAEQGLMLDAHNRVLKVLTNNIVKINQAFVGLRQYQKFLWRKIRAALIGKRYTKNQIKGVNKKTSRLAKTNKLYRKYFQRLWRRNARLWKTMWSIRGQLKKHINLVPKQMKKYLIALALLTRKSYVLNDKINRIMRFLAAMKRSVMINRKTKQNINRNIRNLKRSLQMLQQVIRHVAGPVIAGRTKTDAAVKILLKEVAGIHQFNKDIKQTVAYSAKDVSIAVQQLRKIQKKSSNFVKQLWKQRRLTYSLIRDMKRLAATKQANVIAPSPAIAPVLLKSLTKIHTVEALLARKIFHNRQLLKKLENHVSKQARMTRIVNRKLSHIDRKTTRKLQKQVRHLQRLMVKQKMLHKTMAHGVVKAPVLYASQRNMAWKLKKMERRSRLMNRLTRVMFNKLRKGQVKMKLSVKKMVRHVRIMKKQKKILLKRKQKEWIKMKKKLWHNILYGKLRHGNWYKIMKKLKKWRNARYHNGRRGRLRRKGRKWKMRRGRKGIWRRGKKRKRKGRRGRLRRKGRKWKRGRGRKGVSRRGRKRKRKGRRGRLRRKGRMWKRRRGRKGVSRRGRKRKRKGRRGRLRRKGRKWKRRKGRKGISMKGRKRKHKSRKGQLRRKGRKGKRRRGRKGISKEGRKQKHKSKIGRLRRKGRKWKRRRGRKAYQRKAESGNVRAGEDDCREKVESGRGTKEGKGY